MSLRPVDLRYTSFWNRRAPQLLLRVLRILRPKWFVPARSTLVVRMLIDPDPADSWKGPQADRTSDLRFTVEFPPKRVIWRRAYLARMERLLEAESMARCSIVFDFANYERGGST